MNKVIKRINVDKTMEMFAAAGIEPTQRDNRKCIMAAALHPKSLYEYKEEFDDNYFWGVIDGWDENNLEYRLNVEKLVGGLIDIRSLKYKLGRADGQAALKVWRRSQCSSNVPHAADIGEWVSMRQNTNQT